MIRDTAHFLHGELERNWACREEPYFTDRLRNINEMTTTAHRIGERGMLLFARRFPNASSTLLRRDPSPIHARIIGAGSQHTVLRDGNDVFKIHRRSSFMSARDTELLAHKFKSQHEILSQYLGDLVVDQKTLVLPNKLNRKKSAVTTIQPFVDFEDSGIFNGYTSAIDESMLEQHIDRHPDSVSDFKALAQSGLELYGQTGLLVDTSGLNNIVISSGRVKCLDGLPIETENPVDIDRITSQLGQLNDILS